MTKHGETLRALRVKAESGELSEPFKGSDVNRVLRVTWGDKFLAKYCVGNGYTLEYFIRVSRGLYRFKVRTNPTRTAPGTSIEATN